MSNLDFLPYILHSTFSLFFFTFFHPFFLILLLSVFICFFFSSQFLATWAKGLGKEHSRLLQFGNEGEKTRESTKFLFIKKYMHYICIADVKDVVLIILQRIKATL